MSRSEREGGRGASLARWGAGVGIAAALACGCAVNPGGRSDESPARAAPSEGDPAPEGSSPLCAEARRRLERGDLQASEDALFDATDSAGVRLDELREGELGAMDAATRGGVASCLEVAGDLALRRDRPHAARQAYARAQLVSPGIDLADRWRELERGPLVAATFDAFVERARARFCASALSGGDPERWAWSVALEDRTRGCTVQSAREPEGSGPTGWSARAEHLAMESRAQDEVVLLYVSGPGGMRAYEVADLWASGVGAFSGELAVDALRWEPFSGDMGLSMSVTTWTHDTDAGLCREAGWVDRTHLVCRDDACAKLHPVALAYRVAVHSGDCDEAVSASLRGHALDAQWRGETLRWAPIEPPVELGDVPLTRVPAEEMEAIRAVDDALREAPASPIAELRR